MWVLQDSNYVSEFMPTTDSTFETGADRAPRNSYERRNAKASKPGSNDKAEGFTELPNVDPQSQRRNGSTVSRIASAASAPHRLLLRLIFGAADRIENLLPKK